MNNWFEWERIVQAKNTNNNNNSNEVSNFRTEECWTKTKNTNEFFLGWLLTAASKLWHLYYQQQQHQQQRHSEKHDLIQTASIWLCHVWLWQQPYEPNEYFIVRNACTSMTASAIQIKTKEQTARANTHKQNNNNNNNSKCATVIFFWLCPFRNNEMNSGCTLIISSCPAQITNMHMPFHFYYLWTLVTQPMDRRRFFPLTLLIHRHNDRICESYRNWYLIVWLIKHH